MKHLLAILIFFVASSTYAQNGINYKAVIKDNLGNVVANQSITVKFTILKGSTLDNVYQESQTPTTDANGIIIVTIGQGTTSDDFSTIDWGRDDHFLNVQIDTGAGLTDMGTTQFTAVPYALNAANVTGLEAIDEGNGIGWRLKGNPANYANIGEYAIDMSISPSESTTAGATGLKSFAAGYQTQASGENATAMGLVTRASGNYSTAMGYSTNATGTNSTAMGFGTIASGNYSTATGYFTLASAAYATSMGSQTVASGSSSTALGSSTTATNIGATSMGSGTIASGRSTTSMGRYTTAQSYSGVALGQYNLGIGDSENWVPTDPIFEIGNGVDETNKSNAITVLKNGTITAPSFDLSEITDDKALITKEYADANLTGSGLEIITEAATNGWRLKGRNPANYGNIGNSSVDMSISDLASSTKGATGPTSFASGYNTQASSLYTTAMGQYSIATGYSSFAAGDNASATGQRSTALGFVTVASGVVATALGNHTTASGLSSTAMNSYTSATGDNTTAMGEKTKAEASHSVALGRYNIGGGTLNSWVATDPLFEVGNGTSIILKSNALTILKNGTITAPSFDLAEITDDKALITKEYLDVHSSSGLVAIDEGNGIGYRLKASDPANYNNIGLNAVDLSSSLYASAVLGASGNNATAIGSNTTASGVVSTAMGVGSNASGNTSTAIGYFTTGSGNVSTAMGNETIASLDYATAMGNQTTASGFVATAMGDNTVASAAYTTSIGRYNVGGGNATSWVATDPLFEIGNGSDGNLSNALTVLKNGKVGIGSNQPSGYLEIKATNSGSQPNINLINDGVNGARINFTNTDTTNGNAWTIYGDSNDTDANSVFNIFHPNAPSNGNILQMRGDGRVGINGTPNTEFHVYHGTNAGGDGFELTNTGSNTNFWRMYVNNASGNLQLFSKVQGTTSVGEFNNVTGAYSSTSDRRLKKDFQPLPFTWDNFMKLETLSYLYKSQKDNKRSLGLVAQDVEAIYPELVTYNSDEDVYHMDYSGFGVIAIKAIQKQQKVIESQQSRIEALEAKLTEKDEAYNALSKRIETIETLLKTSKE